MLTRDHSAFSTRLPLGPLRPGVLLALLLAAFAFGCTPKIGDSCTTSTNCSASGDRLCDITQPGGYCTIFNCEPGTCPDNSVCINFGTRLSPANDCSLSNSNSPYQRSFCMAPCSSPGDCRGGYDCVNLSGKLTDGNGKSIPPNGVGAVLADSSGDGRVCVPKTPEGVKDVAAGTPSGVCNGDPDAGPLGSDTGNGGAGGSSAAGSGAGGDSGAAGAPSANEAGAGG